jgi:transposase
VYDVGRTSSFRASRRRKRSAGDGSGKRRANAPQFDLREGLFRLTGTDLTRIDSIDVMTATTVISESAYDMSKWKTENHFVSWLRLRPDNRTVARRSSGKVGCQPTTERPSL